MANPELSSRRFPHLSEVFAVAQTLAGSIAEAETLTIRAFQRTKTLDRFDVLRALVLEAGLDDELKELQSGLPSAPEPAIPPAEAEPQSALPPGSAPSPGPEPSVLESRIVARSRERVVLDAFRSLDTPDRFVAFVAARGIRSGADLARIMKMSPEKAAQALTLVSSRLSERVEHRLGNNPEGRSEDLDRLSAALEGLTEPAGSELRRVVQAESPPPLSRANARRPSRLIPITFVLLLAAATGLLVPRLFPEPPSAESSAAVHLLDAVVAVLPESDTLLDTTDPEEADTWFRRRIDWDFELPRVSGAPLAGTGFVEISPGIQAPTLFYGTSGMRDISVAVVNYALLETAADQLMLDRGSLDRLAETSRPAVERRNTHHVMLTRNRDDIYVVVGESDTDLAGRVSFSN